MRSTSTLIVGIFVIVLVITTGLLAYLFIFSSSNFSLSALLPGNKYSWADAQRKALKNCKKIIELEKNNFPTTIEEREAESKVTREYSNRIFEAVGIKLGPPPGYDLPSNVSNFVGIQPENSGCYMLVVEVNEQTLFLYETMDNKVEKLYLKNINESFFKNPVSK